jgi:hypothetical protein
MFFLGAVWFFVGLEGTIQLLTGGADDTDKISYSDYESGRYVKGTIYGAFDQIASESINSSDNEYYLVCVGNDTDTYYALFKTSDKKLVARLETMCDETWAYNDGKTDKLPTEIKFKGQMATTDYKIEDWRDDYIEKTWGDDGKDEAMKNTLSLTIEETPFGKYTIALNLASFLIMINCGVTALILIISNKKRTNLSYTTNNPMH